MNETLKYDLENIKEVLKHSLNIGLEYLQKLDESPTSVKVK